MNSKILLLALLLTSIPSLATHAQDLGGQWQGGWRSCYTNHRGKLSANFCRIDAQHVQANFRGTFAKVIPFRYKAILNVTEETPEYLRMAGSKKLGPVMGTFRYQATVSGDDFNATYSSKRDRGVWSMRRY